MAERYGTQKGVREIVLTFDDGPNPSNTPKILDILNEQGIKGLFFMVGQCLATPQGRSLMERAHREGHHIGNHTYSHADLKTLPVDGIKDELRRTQELIGDCGHACKFFRPPYGAINATVSKVLQEEGYMTVMWNVDTLDWKLKKDAGWVDHGFEQIQGREDSLVLMHDIHATTAQNLDSFVRRIKSIPQATFTLYA